MDPTEDLSHAIDWYLDVIPRSMRPGAGPPPDSDATASALADIADAIAPLRLPAELVWLWQTWDVRRFSLVPPRLTDPEFALDSWRRNAVESQQPRILFPVAYESWKFRLIELGGPDEYPAPLWEYSYGDGGYELRSASLASLFRAFAAATEAAEVRPPSDETDRDETPGPAFDGSVYFAAVERHLSESPHSGRDRSVADHLPYWPAHWQAAQGVNEESFKRLGATHTVQSFAEAAARGPVLGRIVGRFRVQGGGGIGPGGASASFGRLSDETGSLRALLPNSVLDVGGRRDVVEVELEANGPVSNPPLPNTGAITDAALRGDIASASEAAGEWVSELSRTTDALPVIRRIVPAT